MKRRSLNGARPWMRSAGVVVCVVVALVCAAGAIVVTAQTAPRTIGVDEIQPGMRGYGLSVFRGAEPERFDVEVIDVLRQFRPGQDLILIRTPHPLLNRTRAVGGMSGSPIYLDGRLAGAYAYGWPYGVDPIAGVTPIANMLTELARPIRPDAFPGARALPVATRAQPRARAHSGRASARRAAAGGPSESDHPPDAFSALRSAIASHSPRADDRAIATGAAAATSPTPAQTPLMLGGLTEDVAAMLERELSPLGLIPVQAGGAGPSRAANGGDRPRYVDGGAIGVQLVRGDISMTGIGTVTHVRGDRVIAFGHPMINGGQVGFPTSTARILHVLVSEMRSFKIGEAQTPLGALVHDRQSAIVIDTRVQAPTVPVRIRLHGVEGAPQTEWNVEVAHHPAFAATLTFASLINAIKATAADSTSIVYRARTSLSLEGRAPIEVATRGFMRAGPAEARSLTQLPLFSMMSAALENPFEDARIARVDIDLEVEYRRDILQLLGASVAQSEVEPGAEVPIVLRFRRWGRGEESRVIRVRIPRHAAGELLQLELAPGPEQRREHGRARDLGEHLAHLADRYPATSLVAELKLPSRGLRFEGHAVSALPPSALDALQPANATAVDAPFETRARVEIPLGDVVQGTARLNLRVRDAAEASIRR